MNRYIMRGINSYLLTNFLSTPELAKTASANLKKFFAAGWRRPGAVPNCEICWLLRRKHKGYDRCRMPREDHIRCFRNPWTKERAVIHQPYCGGGEPHRSNDFADLVKESEAFAVEHGLQVRVSREDSWHYPEDSVLVEFRVKEIAQ